MNTSQGRLYYATGIDNSQLRTNAAETRNILHSIGQTATQEGMNVDTAFGRIAKAAGGIFAIGKAQEFAREIVKVRGEIESLQISFETLLNGNKEKANAMFNEIRTFAVQTPMMLKDLAAGAQTMLGFNIEAEKVVPMLKAIGDVSMGDAAKFNSLTLAFAQMSATGKLMGQDLLQMINAGFNPLAVISEKTGKTIGELKKEMESGKITVEMVSDAFISATSAGGKYYGMLDKQSHGINGAISNLQGAIDDLYNSIGEASQGVITESLSGATYLVKNYEKVAEILAVIVGTYGVYKGAIIANEAMIQASLTAKDAAIKAAYESEIASLTGLLPQKEAEVQTSLQQAVAAGHITEAKATEITMLRAEAEAQIEALAATETAARARLMASQADVQAAMKCEDEIQNKISALEEEADALFENGDSIAFDAKQEEIAALQAELLAVQKKRETAVEATNTAVNEMNSAALQQNAIASAEDSAATAINTAQTTTNTGVTSALTIAKTKLTGVVRTLYATISAHPFALAAAAVAALSYGIYKLATYETEAEKAQKRLNAAFAESESNIAAERVQIDVMFDRLRRAKEGTEAYKDAKEAIIQQYGNYLNGLSDEIASLKDVEGAYNAVTEAAVKSARSRAMSTYLDTEMDNYAKDEQKHVEKIIDIIADEKGKEYAQAISQEIHDVIDGKKQWSQDFLNQFNKTSMGMSGYGTAAPASINYLQLATEEAQKRQQTYKKAISDAQDKFGLASPEEDKKEAPKDPKLYKEEVKAKQKELADAQAEVKKLEASATATTEEVKKAHEKVEATKKALKDLGVDTDKNAKTSDKSADIRKQNEDMLANEAANRRKQEEEYTKQLADQAKDSEFEIRQARIDAMKDGIDKELMQNGLNYDRLMEQNKRRERDMLNNLANKRMRVLEDADPTMFKKKNKDGKLEDDPGKRDEKYREIRAKLTIDDLDEEQKAQVKEFGRIAAFAFKQSNKESMDKMLQDVLTYEQQRTKIAEEYDRKRKALYEKNADGSTKTDADGKPILRKDVTQGNIDELNRQETEALKAIDEQFAQREESYKAWCESIANISLKQLQTVLETAQKELEELQKSGSKDEKALAAARAKVNKAQESVNKAKAQDSLNPGKRTIKEWEDLYKTLNEVEKEFESIGDTVGGVVGEIISECGQMAGATMQMINGIMTLANWSITATELASKGASKSIQSLEKASVILTVISAAMQIAMQIAQLFNDDEQKQKEIENLQGRIDQLQWELDNAELIRSQKLAEGGSYLAQMQQALRVTRIEIAKNAAATGDWKNFYNALYSSASKNTALMEATTDKLAKAYTNMAYTADKALGEDKYKGARTEVENLAKQQILLQEQLEKEKDKKKPDKKKQEEIQRQIEENGQKALEVVNNMVEDILGDTASGISDKLANAFFDAFEAGEDAAKAWGDKVNDIVKNVVRSMLISQALEKPVGDLINKYKDQWFEDGNFKGADNVTESMTEFSNDLNGLLGGFKEMMDSLPEDVKEMLTGDSEREASQKGIATASQESVDELNGRATAIQGHTYSISENTKLLVTLTQAILKSVMNIESETRGFGDRLSRMESNLKEATDTLSDISTKGIRLKN